MKKKIVIICDDGSREPAILSCAKYIGDRLLQRNDVDNVTTVTAERWHKERDGNADLTVLLFTSPTARIALNMPTLPKDLQLQDRENNIIAVSALFGVAPINNKLNFNDPTTSAQVAINCIPMQLENAVNPTVSDTAISRAAIASIEAKLGAVSQAPLPLGLQTAAQPGPQPAQPQPPQPQSAQINKIGILGTAGFYKEMRTRSYSSPPDDDTRLLLKRRVWSACKIMLGGKVTQEVEDRIVAAIVNQLQGYSGETPLPAGASDTIKAKFYSYQALMAEDKALFSEAGKRAIGAAAGFFVGAGVIGGSAVGIGVATGSATSEEALDAFKELFNGSVEKFGTELAAGNPILIVFMVGIAIGVASFVVGPLTAVEVSDRFNGRREAAKHLEDVVQTALNAEMAKPTERTV